MTDVRQAYIQLIQSLSQAGQQSATQMSSILAEYGLTPADFYTWVGTNEAQQLGFRTLLNADATVRSYQFINPQGALVPVEGSNIAYSYNSNLGTATNAASSRFTSVISANTALNALDLILTYGTVDKYEPQTPAQQALAFSARLSPEVQIASVACRLGKAIDGAVYDLMEQMGLNPPSSLNPATWANMVSNDEGVVAQAFNWLLALDGEGNVTCYTDEDSFAYCAEWLNENSIFGAGGYSTSKPVNASSTTMYYPDNYTYPIKSAGNISIATRVVTSPKIGVYKAEFSRPVTICATGSGATQAFAFSAEPFTVTTGTYYDDGTTSIIRTDSAAQSTTKDGLQTFYSVSTGILTNSTQPLPQPDSWFNNVSSNTHSTANTNPRKDVWFILTNGVTSDDAPLGVYANGGPLPDTSTWNAADIDGVKQSLQTQYPDLWDNKLEVQTVQPDGTIDRHTYIPIAPVTDVNEQRNPDTQDLPYDYDVIDPETATLTQLQTIIEALTQSLIKTQQAINPVLELEINPEIQIPDGSNEKNPTQEDKNPSNTGIGKIPPVVIPTGEASSLWAVYHPSQSQLNAFGAWLWSSDFVDQIKRLFNDPMQAVIGVHKVFAPIPTSGSATIKCGYLDSGVSAPTVSSQYTEIDCGSVDCREYFGNVFDYDPHTKISIYLPFIGVVPLKVSEVMRSTVNVSYGVDVFTGACLAKVKITRDGGSGILYSFGGSCACHYPVSSGSYAGIISGIVTSAIGIAGGIATGNPLATIGGAISGIKQMHTEVQHSGGFTGCAGAMGPKKPYLIIVRPQTCVADNVDNFFGIPSNYTTTIGSCEGFVKVKKVHVRSANAYKDELSEIERLLHEGVIISD